MEKPTFWSEREGPVVVAGITEVVSTTPGVVGVACCGEYTVQRGRLRQMKMRTVMQNQILYAPVLYSTRFLMGDCFILTKQLCRMSRRPCLTLPNIPENRGLCPHSRENN